MTLGEDGAAGGLVFRFAVETAATGGVERVVFLALRGEDRSECFWPVPLEVAPVAANGAAPVQLRLIADDGYAGPDRPESIVAPVRPAVPRRGRAAPGPAARTRSGPA